MAYCCGVQSSWSTTVDGHWSSFKNLTNICRVRNLFLFKLQVNFLMIDVWINNISCTLSIVNTVVVGALFSGFVGAWVQWLKRLLNVHGVPSSLPAGVKLIIFIYVHAC
jgi:hypothetical protein